MLLELSLLDHRKLAGTIAPEPRTDDYDFSLKQTQYGLASGLSLGLGYGLTEHVELLLRGALSVRKQASTIDAGDEEVASTKDKVRTLELLPMLRYVGSEGDGRFFFGAGLGYEGSKRKAGGEYDGSVKAFAMKAQAGFYVFLRDHVSVDPALELAYVRGTVKLPVAGEQDDLSGSAKGLRVLLTIALSAWLGEQHDSARDAPAEGAERGYAPMEPSAEQSGAALASVQLEGLSVELLGDSARSGTELQLRLTRREDDSPPCPVILLSDHPPEPLEATWYLNGADEVGPIVSGVATVTVSQLEHWLATDPSLSVCGRAQLVRPELRAELEAGLARFKQAGSTTTETAPAETLADDAVGGAPEPGQANPPPSR